MEQAGLKINKEKCIFRQKELHFLGHVIDERGVRPDPWEVRAILELQAAKNVCELKRVLGMINYMGCYTPDLATVGAPLFDLLKGTVAWTWNQPQESAFQKLKETLMTSPVLAYYNPTKATAVSAEASSYRQGGVLLQLNGDRSNEG